MKITGIRTHVARHGQRCRGLLKVETDAGIDGWGEAYSIGPDLSVEPIADYVATMVRGEDPRRIEFIMLKLFQQFRFPPGGTGMAVVSAVDHALWDISGKAAGLPVYMLLGGAARSRVRVYHSIGGKDGQETAARAVQLNEEWGFTAFKLSPYRVDPDATRWGRVCAAAAGYLDEVRRHAPAGFEFAFDPHAKILEPVKAMQLAEALAPHDPLFFEEPLRPEHIPAWARLRQQMTVPLATGESLYGRFEFLNLLAAKAADIIQPDVCVCGGLLEMRKIAALAEAHYVTVAPHNPMSPVATAVNVHFAAATPNFTILEYILPVGNEWKDWVDAPYLPRDGYLELRPDRPGLGIQVCEQAVRNNEYHHWQRTCPVRPDGSTAFI
jgi:galactonate dehydratase